MEASVVSNTSHSTGGGRLLLALIIFAAVCVGLYMLATAPQQTTEISAVTEAVASEEWAEASTGLVFTKVIVDEYSHAAKEHPEDMPAVRNCLNSGQTWKRIYRAPDWKDRYLRVCYDGRDIIFQIVDKIGKVFKERTAYIRDDISDLNQLREFLMKHSS